MATLAVQSVKGGDMGCMLGTWEEREQYWWWEWP